MTKKNTFTNLKLELASSGFRKPCEDDAKDMMILTPDDMCLGIFWDSTAIKVVEYAQQKMIRAYNAHEDLVNSLEKAKEKIIKYGAQTRGVPIFLIMDIEAALAKAKGE